MIIKTKSYFATPFLQMSFPGFLPSCHFRGFSLLSFPGILPLVIPGHFFFSLSFPGLTGESMDVRVKPEHDRKREAMTERERSNDRKRERQ